MSEIILPSRFRKQPQYAAPLDRGSPYHRYVAFAYSAGRGLQDGKHTGVTGSSVGNITHRYGSGGQYITPADGSSYVQFPSVDDYNVLGNITVVARVRLGTIGTQQAIAIKSASSGGIDTPFALLIESDGSIALNRSNNAGGPSFRVWSSSAKLAAGQTAVIAATQNIDISIPPKFYIDGSFDTGTASSLYGGFGFGAAGSTTNPIQLGNRTDLGSRFYGNIFDVVVFSDIFSPSAVNDLSLNLDQIWRAKPRRIWLGSAVTTVTGTVDYTNLNDISSAAGTTTVTGSSATTNANDASAASGTTTVTGSAATTNADDTSAATGSPVVAGTSATTNADDTSSASGSVGSAIVGSVAYTNIDDVSAASGTTTVVGSAAASNVNDTSNASGTTTVVGVSATTNANDVSAATGTAGGAEVIGTVAYTNANDISAASGTTTIIGSSVTTNTNDQSAAFGVVNNGTIVEAGLTSGIATTDKIKKPGIPTDTAPWLKTFLEIIVGRRGNKIEIPKFQELTFSATPTQAECEALHAYTNEVREAVNKIITRLDS